MEFREWPKIARLNREMIVSEKIDGTNACVIVQPAPYGVGADEVHEKGIVVNVNDDLWIVGAQSRKRVIAPGDDSFGFGAWVRANAEALAEALGEGYHFGEWYGSGIQRGYGLEKGDKRFMLFNVRRWQDHVGPWVENMEVATTLYEGPFSTSIVNGIVNELRDTGSRHVPGFMRPEGVVAYHVQGNTSFKVTVEKDEEYKGKQQ